MRIAKNIKKLLIVSAFLGTGWSLYGQVDTSLSDQNFFLKPYGGVSMISAVSPVLKLDGKELPSKVNTGIGFSTGITAGYKFTPNFTVEAGWEYKTNDIDFTVDNKTHLGNYASNTFYLNGIYVFNTKSRFKPYAGAGISFIQEIDLDYETFESERSFSTDGELGVQGLAGLDYLINDRVVLNTELTHTRYASFDLIAEDGSGGELQDLKYNPFVLNVGIKILF